MAVVTVKSSQITSRDATPLSHVAAAFNGGNAKWKSGTVEAANGDSIASKYIFFDVPSNAVIGRVLLYCDAVTGGAGDVGIYQTTANGGAVVDVDYFASAQSIAAALSAGTEISHEADAADSGVGFGLADLEKYLWQGLQLTADSARPYDVVMTLTAAAAAAGTIGLKMLYSTNQ